MEQKRAGGMRSLSGESSKQVAPESKMTGNPATWSAQTPAQSCCFPGLQYGCPVGVGAVSLQNIVRPSALRLEAHLPQLR